MTLWDLYLAACVPVVVVLLVWLWALCRRGQG